MATTAQQVFKKIVVHNKMMTEATVDRLLVQMPDPETVIKFLVKKEKLPLDKGKQLLALYQRQMEKVHGGGSSVIRSDVVKRKPTPDESFDAMFDEILSDKPTDSAAKPVASAEEIKKELEAKQAARAAAEKAKQQAEAKSAAAAAAEAAAAPDEVAKSPPTDPAAEFEIPEVEDSVPDDDELPMLERDTDDEEYELAPTDIPAPKPSATKKAATPAATSATATPTATSATATPTAASHPAEPAGSIDPLLKKILLAARQVNASDVHMKSGEVPIVRVAGRLVEVKGQPAISPEDCERALLSILDSERRQQFLKTNDLDFCYDGGAELGRCRTNFMRQHRGMDGIFRLISSKVPTFEDLKLPPIVKKLCDYKQGIVLVTGPKGCGKTTTLAAMVDLINRTRPEHIITVEDPIEFVHPCKKGHVNQREVGAHTKTFSAALRAALREAPDVILVGEMRDLETTSLAITAAETGHLVFATLHTPDALRTIDRVLDVFPPKEQGQIRSMISESMRGIVSQLLIPSTDGKSQELAVEVLVNTMAIGNLIREAKTFQLRGIMQTGRKMGMQLMDDALVKLAKADKISKQDALAVAVERARVEQELGA